MEKGAPGGRRVVQPLKRAAARLALLLAAVLLVPCAQTVQAVEIYYARAIGQEYLPEARPPAGLPEGGTTRSSPDLPALGDAVRDPPRREMSVWSKLLIGVVLVAAVAALGDADGGSAALNVTPGGSGPDPGTTGTPPQGGGAPEGGGEPLPGADDGGNGGGNGGGIIDIGIGGDDFGDDFDDRDDDDDDNRGRGRGRGRGRDRDRD